jgi:CRP/FNR family transcriptional regulator, cyclic AMP receptor protein
MSFAEIPFSEILGYVGAVVVLVTYSMRTMIPLRALGMVSNVIFLTFGVQRGIYSQIILHSVLLPLNGYRLNQMLQLTRQVRAAAEGDGSMTWLKPFMTKRNCKTGETLFAKDALAEAMFFTVSGRFRLVESGLEIGTGQVVGELGLLAPDQRRTQTLRCEAAGEVLVISYSDVKQLYYQNPEFGFYFLRLATGRLFHNLRTMEAQLSAREELPPQETAPEVA